MKDGYYYNKVHIVCLCLRKSVMTQTVRTEQHIIDLYSSPLREDESISWLCPEQPQLPWPS